MRAEYTHANSALDAIFIQNYLCKSPEGLSSKRTSTFTSQTFEEKENNLILWFCQCQIFIFNLTASFNRQAKNTPMQSIDNIQRTLSQSDKDKTHLLRNVTHVNFQYLADVRKAAVHVIHNIFHDINYMFNTNKFIAVGNPAS